MARAVRLGLVFLTLLMAAASAGAHPPVPTVGIVTVTADRTVRITLVHDALAFALNDTSARIGDPDMYALLNGPEADLVAALADGRERFPIGFRLTADGQRLPVEILESPTLAAVRNWERENPSRRLPCKLDIVAGARLPAGARAFTVRFPEVLADVVVTVERPGAEPVAFPLAPGEESPPIDIGVQVAAGSAAGSAQPAPASTGLGPFSVAARFVRLGFTHILPAGADHCLFVLGLFLLSPRARPVLWQISAFTLAHTITLTLTSLHVVGLPARIVEPTIAASVAFIGVENLFTGQVRPWRVGVAFLFGLAHGMGVATAFNEAGFPPGQLVTSLGAFTVGVEAGHIAVLAGAFALLGWTRSKPWYRRRVAIPLSLIIAGVALVWMGQRLFGPI